MDANILNHDGIACCVVEKIAILEGGGGGGGVCGGGGGIRGWGLIKFFTVSDWGLIRRGAY